MIHNADNLVFKPTLKDKLNDEYVRKNFKFHNGKELPKYYDSSDILKDNDIISYVTPGDEDVVKYAWVERAGHGKRRSQWGVHVRDVIEVFTDLEGNPELLHGHSWSTMLYIDDFLEYRIKLVLDGEDENWNSEVRKYFKFSVRGKYKTD